jgi:hypothetical protein
MGFVTEHKRNILELYLYNQLITIANAQQTDSWMQSRYFMIN